MRTISLESMKELEHHANQIFEICRDMGMDFRTITSPESYLKIEMEVHNYNDVEAVIEIGNLGREWNIAVPFEVEL